MNPEDHAVREILQRVHWIDPDPNRSATAEIREIIRRSNAEHYLPLLKRLQSVGAFGYRDAEVSLANEIARLEGL